jgi:hypothetical protein
MLDTWTSVGTVVGAGALSYLAAGQKIEGKGNTLRLSIDGSGSLLGDVRLLGGMAAVGATYFVEGAKAKAVLKATAAASLASLFVTEIVRYRLAKSGGQVARDLPVFPSMPSWNYGALPAPQRQGAWAQS